MAIFKDNKTTTSENNEDETLIEPSKYDKGGILVYKNKQTGRNYYTEANSIKDWYEYILTKPNSAINKNDKEFLDDFIKLGIDAFTCSVICYDGKYEKKHNWVKKRREIIQADNNCYNIPQPETLSYLDPKIAKCQEPGILCITNKENKKKFYTEGKSVGKRILLIIKSPKTALGTNLESHAFLDDYLKENWNKFDYQLVEKGSQYEDKKARVNKKLQFIKEIPKEERYNTLPYENDFILNESGEVDYNAIYGEDFDSLF